MDANESDSDSEDSVHSMKHTDLPEEWHTYNGIIYAPHLREELVKKMEENVDCLYRNVIDLIITYIEFIYPFLDYERTPREVDYKEQNRFASKLHNDPDTSLAVIDHVFKKGNVYYVSIGIIQTQDEMWIGVTNNPNSTWEDRYSPGEEDARHSWLYYSGFRGWRKKFHCYENSFKPVGELKEIAKYASGNLISLRIDLREGKLSVYNNKILQSECLLPIHSENENYVGEEWYVIVVLDQSDDCVQVIEAREILASTLTSEGRVS